MAKAWEKEQIISVYWDAYNEGKYSTDKTAEEYYKETFKQD
jgi:HEPN domain-containing protein